jgi:hypothetical protein
MPRSTESFESKILQWFRTASPETAHLMLGLVKEAVKENIGVPLRDEVEEVPQRVVRRRRKKANGAPSAEVESFN